MPASQRRETGAPGRGAASLPELYIYSRFILLYSVDFSGKGARHASTRPV
jgi:hypothetical protein